MRKLIITTFAISKENKIMPWCPKCKNEYRAGITVCPDCNEELMEELEEAEKIIIDEYGNVYDLEFIRVPIDESYDDYIKNNLYKEDYDSITELDKYWDGEDIHSYISYMATELRSKSATRARKVSSIRVFFKYLSLKAKLIDVNPAQNLETPKLGKRIPKYLSLDESKKLLEVSQDENNRNTSIR